MKTGNPNRPSSETQVQQSDAERARREACATDQRNKGEAQDEEEEE